MTARRGTPGNDQEQKPHFDGEEGSVGCDADLTGPRSDQGNDFPLRLVIALDIASGRSKARMTGELLDVSEAPADLADLPGGTSNESSTTGV